MFWQDCPLCHALSDFLVLLQCFGRCFCTMGENTQSVSSCPWNMFMDLWLGGRVCFERTVLCAMGSLTFMFCCTVLDVVFAKWGKHTACEFLSMVYVYESVVGWKGLFWQDCPLCHGLSDFRFLLRCFGHGFCTMGGLSLIHI